MARQDKAGYRLAVLADDLVVLLGQANLLAGYAKRIGAHVNLIPLNYVKERGLKPSSASVITMFQNTLLDQGVNVTVRRRLGSDIDASCGQLRRKYIAKE